MEPLRRRGTPDPRRAHRLDAACPDHPRARRDAPFEKFDRFAQFKASDDRTLASLLDEFAELREENLRALTSLELTDTDLDRSGQHPALGVVQRCAQRGLASQPLLRQRFEQPYRSSLWLRRFRWCSSTDPVENVLGMEPPSSHAEALRPEQAAQVHAANCLFVAADELRHLERCQQTVRETAVRGRLLGHRSCRIRCTALLAAASRIGGSMRTWRAGAAVAWFFFDSSISFDPSRSGVAGRDNSVLGLSDS